MIALTKPHQQFITFNSLLFYPVAPTLAAERMSFLKNTFSSKNEEEIIGDYAAFWRWFRKHEKQFYAVIKQGNDIENGFFTPLSAALEQLNSRVFYVAGMYDLQTAELIFTAEGSVATIYFVEELVSHAPGLSGWKFTALKPAIDILGINIRMQDFEFDKERLSFYSTHHKNCPDEIDITLVHQNYVEEHHDALFSGSYIFLENLLGELDSVAIIDHLTLAGPAGTNQDLIPIEKLPAFLTWRQKEFIEKYEGMRRHTENDNYSILEAELGNGKGLIAAMNTDLLKWDAKASHPWLVTVELKYNGSQNNGMPNQETYQLLEEIENSILTQLKDADGYLSLGRQTSDGVREIYFACKEFRKPSKVLTETLKQPMAGIEASFDIYKDKYWLSLSRFNGN